VRREDGNVVYYGYDAADRLTSEEWYDAGMAPLYGFQWDYDAVGNRVYEKRGETETYYAYDAANELLHTRRLPDDAWSYFQYDPMGNTTAIQEPGGTTYFAYIGAGLVSAIAYKTGVANYFYYDAELRRYAIEESTGLRYFTWDENGMNLLCERDAAGAVVAEYAHGETPINGIGSLTAAKKADGGSTYYQYPVYDHRGTVMRLTDAEGSVTATYEYDAWGNALQAADSPAGNRFRYQSNWRALRDSGSGLLLSPTRVYDATLGRFLQRDQSPVTSTDFVAYKADAYGWDVAQVLSAHRGAVSAGQVLTGRLIAVASRPSLCVYGLSRPTVTVDADGRWDYRVHFADTATWAVDVDYTGWAAAAVANGCNWVDNEASGIHPRPSGDYSYHFDVKHSKRANIICHPNDPGARARRYKEHRDEAEAIGCCTKAEAQRALRELGIGFHPWQDRFSHQWRGQQPRNEGGWHYAETPLLHIGKCLRSPGANAVDWYRPDDRVKFASDVARTESATKTGLRAFLRKCPLARKES